MIRKRTYTGDYNSWSKLFLKLMGGASQFEKQCLRAVNKIKRNAFNERLFDQLCFENDEGYNRSLLTQNEIDSSYFQLKRSQINRIKMEYMENKTQTIGRIKCCDCDFLIEPNATNMCAECLRKRVDITDGIPKQVAIQCCSHCNRYLKPPDQWLVCALESKELLAFCLKKLKGLKQVHLVDATFLWTEPHSKRLKVKLIVQKEAFGVILQQEFVVEYVVQSFMCSSCHKIEGKNYWRAVVQLRQRVAHKKTFFYLEQLILKHSMHSNCINIKAIHAGVDFFFTKKDDARKMVDFFMSVVPCKYTTAQQLISHDTHSNTFDYKHTFSVEIVPICRDDVVCLPLSLSRSLGNIGQVCICYRVTNSLSLIDPRTLQIAEVSTQQFWRTPFCAIGSLKQCTEYTVMDTNMIADFERISFAGQGKLSYKHVLADAWVVRSSELGMTENLVHSRTHLGHLLKPGDSVLGLDLSTININDMEYNKLKKENLPDVILVKKAYGEKAYRRRRRAWKLKHLNIDAETDLTGTDAGLEDFLEDLEEDAEYRQNVNIYKDHDKIAVDENDVDDDVPRITLQDMLDDLVLEGDATDEEGGPMME
ncbi:60S ribosomal export protein NMD3 [Trichonephila clavata]|uniref:60S ribosomal export protein NMD3 n=1 Tax=Trichonephila clavata TaxID=2740835 RepID=A0A8X6KJM9_TRICU|nr:60S ribosomal export protein NMD3 [Trichonephila clavata]